MKFTAKVIILVAAMAVSVFAQSDTIRVHVQTNAPAMVSIVPNIDEPGFAGDSGATMNTVGQPVIATLRLVAPAFNSSVRHGAGRTTSAATAAYRRGNVQLNLNSQDFENAQVSLYTVNGRRIMRGSVGRGEGISRRNVATGVYIMNVAGANGNNFSYRFTHGGGRLEIVPTFAGAGSDNRQTMRQAVLPPSTFWTVSARALQSRPVLYRDTSFTIVDPQDNDTISIVLNEQGDNGNGDEWLSALEFFRSRDVRLGWNLGNTLDAVCRGQGSDPSVCSASDFNVALERAWWNPSVTQTLINGLRDEGVDLVRITSSWIGHIGNAPDYTVSQARLDRVKQVVDMVIGAGMIAIINIHHDGNYTNPPNTWGFLKFAEVMRGEHDNAQVVDQLGKVWAQIANHFKDYGPELIFETLNEIHAGDWGSQNNQSQQQRLHEWNTTALNAIRATGGNNAKRYVAVPGLGSTEPDYVISSHGRGLLLPPDGANGTNHLIVSVHFYAPFWYTVAEVVPSQTDGQPLLHEIGQSDLNHIDAEAARIKSTFIDNGIAAYYGEWGAPTRTRAQASAGGVTMTQTIRNAHVDYIQRVASAAVSNGIVPIIWDDGGNFQMIDRANGNPATSIWNNEEERQVQSTFLTQVWNAYKQAVGK